MISLSFLQNTHGQHARTHTFPIKAALTSTDRILSSSRSRRHTLRAAQTVAAALRNCHAALHLSPPVTPAFWTKGTGQLGELIGGVCVCVREEMSN